MWVRSDSAAKCFTFCICLAGWQLQVFLTWRQVLILVSKTPTSSSSPSSHYGIKDESSLRIHVSCYRTRGLREHWYSRFPINRFEGCPPLRVLLIWEGESSPITSLLEVGRERRKLKCYLLIRHTGGTSGALAISLLYLRKWLRKTLAHYTMLVHAGAVLEMAGVHVFYRGARSSYVGLHLRRLSLYLFFGDSS